MSIMRDSQPHSSMCDREPQEPRRKNTTAISPDDEWGEVIVLPLARLAGRFAGMSEAKLRACLSVSVRMDLDLDELLDLVRYLDSPAFLAERARRGRPPMGV